MRHSSLHKRLSELNCLETRKPIRHEIVLNCCEYNAKPISTFRRYYCITIEIKIIFSQHALNRPSSPCILFWRRQNWNRKNFFFCFSTMTGVPLLLLSVHQFTWRKNLNQQQCQVNGRYIPCSNIILFSFSNILDKLNRLALWHTLVFVFKVRPTVLASYDCS